MLPLMRKCRVAPLATTILKAAETGSQLQVRASVMQTDLSLRPPVRQFDLTNVTEFEQIVDTGYQYERSEPEKWLNMTEGKSLIR